MYKKVVVPLDGSKLAEAALPHLEEVAKGCHIADVLLVSATEKVTGNIPSGQVSESFITDQPTISPTQQLIVFQPGVVFGTASPKIQNTPVHLGKMAKTATDYLYKVAQELQNKGFRVTASVVVGDPAEEIVHFAEEQSADLIIMASRGKSGFNRWNMSNIAEKIIRTTNIPILLIKPKADFKETRPKRRGVAA